MPTTITVAIDPHVHSEASYDGYEPVELLLEHVSDIDLDGIVVTDHDRIAESVRAAELAPEYGLIGIPGIEISTKHGHLLAIGVWERIEPGLSYPDTVERIRSAGGVSIVPHPFQRSRHGVRKRYIENVDAIEVYNSMVFTGYRNRRANTFSERNGYPKIGASDAHHLPNVGRAYTEITVPVDNAAITPAELGGAHVIDAIRAGATEIQGKRTPIHKSTRQYAKGALRKSLYLSTKYVPVVPTFPRSMRK